MPNNMVSVSKPDQDLIDTVIHALTVSKAYALSESFDSGNGGPWVRAERAGRAFRNVIDTTRWQTNSQIYLPLPKRVCLTMLPNIMSYLLEGDDLFDLHPVYPGSVDTDTARAVRDYIQYIIRTSSGFTFRGATTILNALRYGNGYGIVEPNIITPPEWSTIQEGYDGASLRTLIPGRSVYQTRYRDIDYVRVLPSPSGGATPNEREWIIFIDHITESELRALVKDEDSGVSLKTSVDEIVKRARQNAIDGNVAGVLGAIAYFTGDMSLVSRLSHARAASNAYPKLQVRIPIIKFFSSNLHVWIANGDEVIYKIEPEDFETLRCPILKASITVDGENFFPDGVITAWEDMFDAMNVLTNLFFDNLDDQVRPRFLRNRAVFSGNLNLKPYGETDVWGDVRAAIGKIEFPQLPPASFDLFRFVYEFTKGAVGQSDQLESQGQVGIVRGGSGALESLLNTMGARDKFTASLLQNSFFSDLIMEILLCEQVSQPQIGSARWETNMGREVTRHQVSYGDLRHAFKVDFEFRERMRNEAAEASVTLGRVNALMSQPVLARLANPEVLMRMIVGNQRDHDRLRQGAEPAAYDRLTQFFESMGRAPAGGRGGSAGGGTPGMPGQGGAGAMQQVEQSLGARR